MSKIPNEISNIIDQFVKGANEILGSRVEKIILLW